MPVYFGLPLTIEESFRLLKLNFEDILNEIMTKHKLSRHSYLDCYFIDYLNKYFKECSVNMKIFYTDKGQCIIGYEIKEPSNVWNKFINVDEFIILLSNLKTEFALESLDLDIDFSVVTLEYMEGEPEVTSYPAPFVISY